MPPRSKPLAIRLQEPELDALQFLIDKYRADFAAQNFPNRVDTTFTIGSAILATAKSFGWTEPNVATPKSAPPEPSAPPPAPALPPAPPPPTPAPVPPKPAPQTPNQKSSPPTNKKTPIKPPAKSDSPQLPLRISTIVSRVERFGYSLDELAEDANVDPVALKHDKLTSSEFQLVQECADRTEREYVRARLLRAHAAGKFQWKDLAESLAIKGPNLSAFKSAKKLNGIGIDAVRRMDAWLQERGF